MSVESEKIEAIKFRYKNSLPSKAETVGQYVAQVATENFMNMRFYEDLNGYLHKLAGSAGMYGYNDISALARECMRCIDQKQKESLTENLVTLKNLLLAQA